MAEYGMFVDFIRKEALRAVGATNPCRVLYGMVEAVEPLRIFVDQRMILDERELILTRNVRDYETEISFDDPAVKQVYTTWDMDEEEESSPAKLSFKEKERHKVTVYNGLQVGERVVMMQEVGGQRFVVLDRIGE